MKHANRNLPVRLLTVPEAAERLGLMISHLDRLVGDGRLTAVRVSAHSGRRFWPADVDAAAAGLAGLVPAAEPPAAAPEPAEARRHTARLRPPTGPRHPRWARYQVVAERAPSSYLAFRDADHVTSYLQARATLLLDADRSVHGDRGKPAPGRELVRR
jgi:excisionase family DNA binding protein